MSELLEKISQIVQEMDDLHQQATEIGVSRTLHLLDQAGYEVGQSWSKSWQGYHANVYYQDFRSPETGAYFNASRGLRNRGKFGPPTSGAWVEYDPQTVIEEIHDRAGDPDIAPLLSFKQTADARFRNAKSNLLSIIDIEMHRRHSEFLAARKDELNALLTSTEVQVINAWRPKRQGTNDLDALQQGPTTPPHLQVRAGVAALQSTVASVRSLGELSNQVKFHISHEHRRMQGEGSTGNRVFLGHGHSHLWRDLKEFLTERLDLQVDEFSRISTAGLSTKERLQTMLDTSGFAFLVMTGEDEQIDGKLRARGNVVHEAGLFQGRLGFEKAIVLLEETCEEFSNIHGIGQIRFLKGNIKASFEEIREVLKREGFINA